MSSPVLGLVVGNDVVDPVTGESLRDVWQLSGNPVLGPNEMIATTHLFGLPLFADPTGAALTSSDFLLAPDPADWETA